MKQKCIFLLGFCMLNLTVFSQKKMNLTDCENQFLKNNLFLLAAHFNIDAAKAITIQSKIWENPVFSADLNAYNPERQKYFDFVSNGGKSLGISQLIYLGGKKRNQIELAKNNEQQTELEFEDLLRHLKLQLRESFFLVFYDGKKLEIFNNQISNLSDLIKSYSTQVQKGNLPLKDLVRLESLFLDLKNQRSEVLNNKIEGQSNLNLLLNQQDEITPEFSEIEFLKFTQLSLVEISKLEDIALHNRPDFLVAQKNIEANAINLKLQKSLSIPDLNFGVSYTQFGGAFANQKNINITIPLPLWNKNKGNIALAKTQLLQSESTIQGLTLELQNEILANFKKWDEATKNYLELKPSTIFDFEMVYKGVLENFQRKNLSLLDFTDFMESYNLSVVQTNELKKKVAIAAQELNASTNKDLF